MRTFPEEERTLSDPEDKGIEGNSRSEVPADYRMISFPSSGILILTQEPKFGSALLWDVVYYIVSNVNQITEAFKRNI